MGKGLCTTISSPLSPLTISLNNSPTLDLSTKENNTYADPVQSALARPCATQAAKLYSKIETAKNTGVGATDTAPSSSNEAVYQKYASPGSGV